MSDQTVTLVKSFVTYLAFYIVFSKVEFFMFFQLTYNVKYLTAIYAFLSLLLKMGFLMFLKFLFIFE